MLKLLIIYDVDGWAYHRRAVALQKYAPAGWTVDICAHRYQGMPLAGYDVVFLLDYTLVGYYSSVLKGKARRALLVCAHNNPAKVHLWPGRFADWTVCNNLLAWEAMQRPEKSCCIANGVDPELWQSTTPINEREQRVLWCGAAKAGKGHALLAPLAKLLEPLGFQTDFRTITSARSTAVYGTQRQAEWYGRGSYVLCTSAHEATPNTSLEGMAAGCVLVSTAVGNVLEFGRHEENCVLCPGTPEAFVAGLLYAREHRQRLSLAGSEAMRGWAYGAPGHRAAYFYRLFERLVQAGPDALEPFSYSETRPE